MEYFTKKNYVRLKSLHNKYLVATDNGESIKQSRVGNTIQAYWAVETVASIPNLIRLRSYLGKLLAASDKAFLLGWTGDKAVQSSGSDSDPSVLWEPVRDHLSFIRLRNPLYDKFLRANGGGPPWRNSVTVDMPECAATHEWILWRIETLDDEIVDVDLRNVEKTEKMCSSSSLESDQSVHSLNTECSTPSSFASFHLSYKTGIVDVHNVKTIRLLIHSNKYLTAHEDGESVIQGRDESKKQAYWTVEHLPSDAGKRWVRLKSSYEKYLTATDDNFLLGVTGKKVKQQKRLKWLDYSIHWELIKVDNKVKLKTWNGNFLKANGGFPPWRNSVTHDLSTSIPTSILWEIQVFEVYGN